MVNNKKPVSKKRLFALFLCICLTVMTCVSCSSSDKKGAPYESIVLDFPKDDSNSDNTNSKDKNSSDDEVFSNLMLEIFKNELCDNTITLHFNLKNPSKYGIEHYTPTLGEVSQKDNDKNADEAADYLNRINKISYENLDESHKITYDVIKDSLELSVKSKEFPYYNEPLKPLLGIQNELPIVFAEYTFDTKQDIDDYLVLLADTERYMSDVITYEKQKSAAGLFMADECADKVIDDCTAFLKDLNNHFLLKTFEERLDDFKGLTDKEKTDYIAKNKELVTVEMANAYRSLIEGLRDLKGTGKYSGGVCQYPNGKKYYEYLVRCSTGSSRSISELEKMTEESIQNSINTLNKISIKDKDIYDKYTNFSFSITEPEKCINDLYKKMQADFPKFKTEVDLKIKSVSESMEKNSSPAFYLIPPIDNLKDNVIYLNNSSLNGSNMYSTLAHEGFPGHLYQTVYSSSFENEPIRSILNYKGFSEGWAQYVEQMAYDYDSSKDRNLLNFAKENNSCILGIYAYFDFKINYDGWSLDECSKWAKKYLSIDDSSCKDIYYTLVSQPGNYLQYYIGALEFNALKEEYKKEKGDDFSLKEFHKAVLEIGEAPFDVIRKHMK